MSLGALDALDETRARAALTHCCGATRWVEAMLAARPYGDRAQLLAAADAADRALTREDWLEAFRHHPRIGDLASLRERFASTAAWASQEQGGVAAASDETLRALAAGNAAYEARFGHIFIVCATGLGADEMLARLIARLGNDEVTELAIAANEQAKITRLRLEKWIAGALPAGGSPA